MAIEPTDPRLTAYALGEMPESEQGAFESELDDAARAEIASIRALAQTLTETLAAPAPVGEAACLTPAQRQRIAVQAARKPILRLGAPHLRVAALLFIGLGLGLVANEYAKNPRMFDSGQAMSGREVATDSKAADKKILLPALAQRVADPLESAVSEMPEGSKSIDIPQPNIESQSLSDVSTYTYRADKSKMAPAAGKDIESLTSLRKSGAVKIGGDIELDVNVVAKDDFGKIQYHAADPNLNVRVDTKSEVSTFIKIDVDDFNDGDADQRQLEKGYRGFAGRKIGKDAKAVPAASVTREEEASERAAEAASSPSMPQHEVLPENDFLPVSASSDRNLLSTFSTDVDTAGYSMIRNHLKQNLRVPVGAVRIEEMVNYFRYAYPQPEGDAPFACAVEIAACPWKPAHRLARIGLKGREIDNAKRPAANLVFLLDVSGSMSSPNKLPLLKQSLSRLVDGLRADDRVAMVVYAGASGLVLPSTACEDRAAVKQALDRLSAGGSTNGGAGIELAYSTAQAAFKKDGLNRVILCTDGDFNVGTTDQGALVKLIEEKAKSGVFLTVLGFGMGNYKDGTLEKLADKGNGNYAYIDNEKEATKILVEGLVGTITTIAKDVKFQVEFNPGKVAAYRLIGYENRMLKAEDFNDDKKDAGEVGAGHTVTALYEIVPAGIPLADEAARPAVDALKYVKPTTEATTVAGSNEIFTVKVRYKKPDGDTSTKLEFPISDSGREWAASSADYRLAAAVAAFGMKLRESKYAEGITWGAVEEWATEARTPDAALGAIAGDAEGARRTELLELIRAATALYPTNKDTTQPAHVVPAPKESLRPGEPPVHILGNED